MKRGFGALWSKLTSAVLETPGSTPPALRRAAFRIAAGGQADAEDAIRAFVQKVASKAHAVTDDDIAALRAAGLDEDAVFELTLSAAMGAGSVRYERGLEALREGMRAPPEG